MTDVDASASVTDASMRVLTNLANLTPAHRGAFEAAFLAAARAELTGTGGPPAAAVWDSLHELVLSLRVAMEETDPARLERLRSGLTGQPGPLKEAARSVCKRSPDVAALLGLPAVLDQINQKRSAR